MRITVHEGQRWDVIITSDNLDFLKILKGQLTTQATKTYQRPAKFLANSKTLHTDTIDVKLFTEIAPNTISCRFGLLDYVLFVISAMLQPADELEYNVRKGQGIELRQEWVERFNNHPRGFGAWQIEDFSRITRHRSGLANLFTGYGKTELLCALVDHSSRRTAILVPSNTVLDEVHLRLEKFRIAHGIYDWQQRINIINPIGFLRSKRYDAAARQWLSEVELAVSEECHHVSCDSWEKLFRHMRLQRSYGFSATSDVIDGKLYLPGRDSLREAGLRVSQVYGLVGIPRVYRKSPSEVSVLKVITRTSPDKVPTYDDWMQAYDATVLSTKFTAVVLSSLMRYSANKKFYIPIYKIATGRVLHQRLAALGLDGYLWTSEGLIDRNGRPAASKSETETQRPGAASERLVDKNGQPNASMGEAGTRRPDRNGRSAGTGAEGAGPSEKILAPDASVIGGGELAFLKHAVRRDGFRYVISTIVEGVDLPELNAIIPLVGTKYRLVIQPAGRAARGENMLIVLIYDLANPLVLSQSKSRREIIENEYNVVENKTIQL